MQPMNQTPKQLKRQKKREFKQQKKQKTEQLRKEIRNYLDQKEANLENTKENQTQLEEIWDTLKELDKMTPLDMENFCLEFNIKIEEKE